MPLPTPPPEREVTFRGPPWLHAHHILKIIKWETKTVDVSQLILTPADLVGFYNKEDYYEFTFEVEMSAEPSCAGRAVLTPWGVKTPSGEPTKLNAHFQNLSQRGCTTWNAPIPVGSQYAKTWKFPFKGQLSSAGGGGPRSPVSSLLLLRSSGKG